MSNHTQTHGVNSTIDHEPGTNDTLVGTQSGALVEKTFGTTAAGNAIVQRLAGGGITLPAADPTNPTDAASKGYIDAQIATGKTWKELVLSQVQLKDDPSGGLLQAILCAVVTQLTAGDTFKINDGTTEEVWTAVAGAPAAFQFQIGGSAPATQVNLVAAIVADSTLWSAVESTTLDAYFSSLSDPQIIIFRQAISANPDRIYGTISGGQSGVQVVEFATGPQNYQESSGLQSDLPSADPSAKRFGFGRASTAINGGDTHRIAEDNTAFAWDSNTNVWQQVDTGTTNTAGDGIDITGAKISTKEATPVVGAGTQQFGAITNRRNVDATGTAATDLGYSAVKTDDSDLAVDKTTNALVIKPGSRLSTFKGFGSWSSSGPADKTPILTEYQSFFSGGANDIGKWGFMVESGGGGKTTTFLVYKKANVGVLADFHSVGMDA